MQWKSILGVLPKICENFFGNFLKMDFLKNCMKFSKKKCAFGEQNFQKLINGVVQIRTGWPKKFEISISAPARLFGTKEEPNCGSSHLLSSAVPVSDGAYGLRQRSNWGGMTRKVGADIASGARPPQETNLGRVTTSYHSSWLMHGIKPINRPTTAYNKLEISIYV